MLITKIPAMPLFQLGQDRPQVHPSVFVAPGAIVVGKVELHENSSVWFNVSLRGDNDLIVLGEGSNIQEGAVVHLASDRGVQIGDLVTVGHRAIVHACALGDEVLVGMGAIVMDGTEVGARSIIGAGAVVTSDVAPGITVAGVPARPTTP